MTIQIEPEFSALSVYEVFRAIPALLPYQNNDFRGVTQKPPRYTHLRKMLYRREPNTNPPLKDPQISNIDQLVLGQIAGSLNLAPACIRAKFLRRSRQLVFGQKRLFSGKTSLYSGKTACPRAF